MTIMIPNIRTTVVNAALELIIAKTPSNNKMIEEIMVRSLETLNFENVRNMPLSPLTTQLIPMRKRTYCGWMNE